MPDDNQLKLYFDYLSQPSRALYIILKVRENLTTDYKCKVNRFQKVPAIIDGEFKLAESIAILRYFSNKQYILDYLYPSNLYKRALVDEFLQWQHTTIRSSCSLYFRFLWVQKKVFGAPAEMGKISKYKKEMERDLNIMETLWLKDSKYLIEETLTAADIFGACEVEQIRVTGYNVCEKYPKIAAWIELVRSQLRPHFDIAHQIIYKYEAETKGKL